MVPEMNADAGNPSTHPLGVDEWRGRVDVRLDHLEKGQDRLQAAIQDVHSGLLAQTRWLIGILVAVAGAAIAVGVRIWTA